MSQRRSDLHTLLNFSIYFQLIFTEIGWMIENVNFLIAHHTIYNVRNF